MSIFFVIIGSCGEVKLDAAGSRGGGGRRLQYTWTVAWSKDQDMGQITASDTADLNSINSTLGNLSSTKTKVTITSNNLKFDKLYEFRVSVKNFLGESSPIATLVVTRENKQIPVVDAGAEKVSMKSSRGLTITGT